MESSESYFIALTTKWCKEMEVTTSFEQNRPSLEAYLTKQLEKIRIDAKQLSFEVFLTNTSELLQITKNLLSVLPVITDDKLLLLTIKIVVIIYSKLITSYNTTGLSRVVSCTSIISSIISACQLLLNNLTTRKESNTAMFCDKSEIKVGDVNHNFEKNAKNETTFQKSHDKANEMVISTNDSKECVQEIAFDNSPLYNDSDQQEMQNDFTEEIKSEPKKRKIENKDGSQINDKEDEEIQKFIHFSTLLLNAILHIERTGQITVIKDSLYKMSDKSAIKDRQETPFIDPNSSLKFLENNTNPTTINIDMFIHHPKQTKLALIEQHSQIALYSIFCWISEHINHDTGKVSTTKGSILFSWKMKPFFDDLFNKDRLSLIIASQQVHIFDLFSTICQTQADNPKFIIMAQSYGEALSSKFIYAKEGEEYSISPIESYFPFSSAEYFKLLINIPTTFDYLTVEKGMKYVQKLNDLFDNITENKIKVSWLTILFGRKLLLLINHLLQSELNREQISLLTKTIQMCYGKSFNLLTS